MMKEMSLNKNLIKNASILLAVFTFLALGLLGFAPMVESAQTKVASKATPTPAKKKTTPTPAKNAKATPKPTPKVTPKSTPKPKTTPQPTPKPRATPKPTPKPAPKTTPTPTKPAVSAVSQQIITIVAGARVRSKASTSSPELRRVKLGTLVKIIEGSTSVWFKVEIPASPKPIVGWMSEQVADKFDAAKRDETFQKIVDRNFNTDAMSFMDASELYDFLTRAQDEVKNAKLQPDFALKRLLILQTAVKAIPLDKANQKPYGDFLKANEKSVIYSEPAGEWYVRSEIMWELRKKYANIPFAEEIARIAAKNPLPGECEGYVNCYLFLMRETDAKYLEFYPNGKYSLESIKNLQNLLEPIIADLTEKQVYIGPTDVSDRAEFNRLISEIRSIASKFTIEEPEKQKLVQQLNQVAEGFR